MTKTKNSNMEGRSVPAEARTKAAPELARQRNPVATSMGKSTSTPTTLATMRRRLVRLLAHAGVYMLASHHHV